MENRFDRIIAISLWYHFLTHPVVWTALSLSKSDYTGHPLKSSRVRMNTSVFATDGHSVKSPLGCYVFMCCWTGPSTRRIPDRSQCWCVREWEYSPILDAHICLSTDLAWVACGAPDSCCLPLFSFGFQCSNAVWLKLLDGSLAYISISFKWGLFQHFSGVARCVYVGQCRPTCKFFFVNINVSDRLLSCSPPYTEKHGSSAPRKSITQPTFWPHVASPTWSSTEQVARPATKRFHPSHWRPLEACCRPWTWWCNDATAVAC